VNCIIPFLLRLVVFMHFLGKNGASPMKFGRISTIPIDRVQRFLGHAKIIEMECATRQRQCINYRLGFFLRDFAPPI
jgi:hypothetical protein